MTAAGLLLAAGESRRFGPDDKLLAPLEGRPLVAHAALMLRAAGLAPLIAVVSSDSVAAMLGGFTVIRLPEGPAEQSRSLAAGVAEAEARGVSRLLVALGDMPRVTADLVAGVIARCPAGGASAATDGSRPMPPACFDRALFADLRAATGDRGAAHILRGLAPGALVAAPAGTLTDVDTPEALARLAAPPGDG